MPRFVYREHADRTTERGITLLRRLPCREYLGTAHWSRVRAWALERAGHACALCPSTSRLNVHHRTYDRKGFEQPEDVIVLCRECHERHHDILTTREPCRAPTAPASGLRWIA